jgi:AbrB family looped-hinge helix DNA binding protein
MAVRSKVDKHGRVLIPSEIRRELGLEPGEAISLVIEDGALKIISVARAIQHMQEVARRYTGGRTGLVDEFIAERRREAERE